MRELPFAPQFTHFLPTCGGCARIFSTMRVIPSGMSRVMKFSLSFLKLLLNQRHRYARIFPRAVLEKLPEGQNPGLWVWKRGLEK
jgi:hypothetical protein